MSIKKSNELPANDAHAFRDETGRFPLDALLRKHGWKIARRPKGKEPKWEKGGSEVHQGAIIATLPKQEIREATTTEKYRESEY